MENADTGDLVISGMCKHVSSSSTKEPLSEFDIANTGEKLSTIFDEILNLKVEQASSHEIIASTHEYMKLACGKIVNICNVTNKQSHLLKTLSYKSIDLEARGRKNNLIFRGISESRYENCATRVFEF
ncbi:hypothetical protein DPMN_040861 [Dreissena polymorpha]|uniref:Uncharacterized protein n=1 Tax=Dreissena polymorpha TaxID=45954 RepID=A0A9D4CYC8_DREPO|nr:hypothetical protein DPMN_040861 [Dreissena polymorpha]